MERRAGGLMLVWFVALFLGVCLGWALERRLAEQRLAPGPPRWEVRLWQDGRELAGWRSLDEPTFDEWGACRFTGESGQPIVVAPRQGAISFEKVRQERADTGAE